MNDNPHILITHKKSTYENFVLDKHDAAVAALIEAGDISVRSLQRSHRAHAESLDAICAHLDKLGIRFDKRERGDPRCTDDYDLVLSVGGDGTALDISHRIADTPLLAINSDPQSSIGYFCAGTAAEFPDLLERTLKQRWKPFELQRFRMRINGEISSVPVLNDVLITHSNPAAVSRYLLTINDNEPEEQKSSGIWISTPAGSTAAIRSAGGYVLPLDSRRLQYLVREPYPLPSKNYHFLKGIRPLGERFEVISKMAEGRIFVDGPHISHSFTIGDVVDIDADASPLLIYGLDERRRTAE
jgi:NAD+ kinase